jgi:flagellar motor switch protein FliM
MEKSLSQAQIDSVFGGGGEAASAETVTDFDFGAHRSLSAEQNQEIGEICERFARSLSSSLGGWLKADVAVALVTIERASYAELMEGATERTTYFSSMQFDAVSAASLMQLDMQLGYCILDLLLGGTGKPSTNSELTQVDEQLFQAIMGFVCDELTTTWRSLGLVARCRDRLIHTQIVRLMPSDEQALCLMFEMKVGMTQGNLVITLPAAVSSFLLRQLGGTWKGHREHPPVVRDRLLQLSRKIKYFVTLQLPAAPLSFAKLENLARGDILMLNIDAGTRPHLLLAGRSLYEASPVRQGGSRAALIETAVPQE